MKELSLVDDEELLNYWYQLIEEILKLFLLWFLLIRFNVVLG